MTKKELQAEIAIQKTENAALKHELAQLKRLIFGSKQERFVPTENPEQLALDLAQEAVNEELVVVKETITYDRKKKAHPGRTKLPENLPTEDIIIEPEEDTSEMERIGEEITETIDYQPGILLKRRYIRPKYARKTEVEGQPTVIIGTLPDRPIPKGIPEAGLLAHLLVSKYVDHLPFYRQIEQFKRDHGWSIHQSTINDWFAACCKLLEPLYDKLLDQVLQTDYLQADESPIKVLDKDKKGSTHQGYMWVYRNPATGLVLFDYRKGLGMHGPKERLADFRGYLQCDGYKVYDSMAKKRQDQSLQLISCLAHIRRKFFDAKANHPELAENALGQIQSLYKIEQSCREQEMTAPKRQQIRNQQAKPIFENLVAWVSEQHRNNLSKEPIGKALKYANDQLPKLAAYMEDGRIEIDNNLIENAIRPLALGRKNYLFAGSHQAAQRTAMMYSFMATCKTLGLNPKQWLANTLTAVGTCPVNKVEELLPGRS